MKRRTMVVALSTTLALSLGVVGCGDKTGDVKPDDVTQGQETIDTRRHIGEAGEGVVEIQITNGLGAPIATMGIRAAGIGDFGGDLLEGMALDNGEICILGVPQGLAAADLLVVQAGADGGIVFDNVPTEGVVAMTLGAADGRTYVDFIRADGTAGSTRDIAIVAQAEAPTAEVVVQEVAPAAEAAQETQTPEPVQDVAPAVEEDFEEPVVYIEAPMQAPESAPEQTEQSCIDDVVLK